MTISFKGLNDSTMYSGVPPPPASELPAVLPICPPPPGFSDSEHSLSDCDSLGSEPGQGQSSFQRFGFSRVSKPRSLAVPSLQEQLRMDRAVGQVSSDQFRALFSASYSLSETAEPLLPGPGVSDDARQEVDERDSGGSPCTCR